MDYSPEEEFMNQSQFAKRWLVSRQYISKLVRREQFLKRLERRRELTQEEIDLVDNDLQLCPENFT